MVRAPILTEIQLHDGIRRLAQDYLPEDTIMALINYVDCVNVSFGATEVIYSTESEEALKLEKRALENDLHLLQAKVKHLGTENNLRILKNIFENMKSRVTFRFGTASTASTL